MRFSMTGARAYANSFAADVRALGASAPLRAAYEVSKRSDFHRVLLRSADPEKVPPSRQLRFGVELPTSSLAKERCINDARLIAAQGTRVFGGRARTGVAGSWLLDPVVEYKWPGSVPWWRIDLRSDRKNLDVKFVWEAGRHRDLVVLARASAIDPTGTWMSELTRLLTRWIEECPPERGIHWYSSLELALRAISWAQVIGLVGDRLPESLRRDMDYFLFASARHILVELPYTVSSMKNNHMIGDGLGLVVLGRMFPSSKGRWERIGDRLMLAQLRRHMRNDGSMIEDSLSYHRFVMEMLFVRTLLGDAPGEVRRALEGAAIHLAKLGVLDGLVPQYGDWDEGRVLADSGAAGTTAGSTWAALALSGYAVSEERLEQHDEAAWYVPRGVAAAGTRAVPGSSQIVGDFFRLRSGKLTVWFKAGLGPSHGHGDVTSVWILKNDRWLTRDPGTGTYNGELYIRNGFRTSGAHPVWVPLGEDQLVPHREFRWKRSIRVANSSVVSLGNVLACLSVHDAFRDAHGRVARLVLLSPEGVTIMDSVERSSGRWSMAVPLGEGVSEEDFFGLKNSSTVTGQAEPWKGWHSSTYGSWDRSNWLEVTSDFTEEKMVWGVGVASSITAELKWHPEHVEVFLNDHGESVTLETNGAR